MNRTRSQAAWAASTDRDFSRMHVCAEPAWMSELSSREFLAVFTRNLSKKLVPNQRRLDGEASVLLVREFGRLLSDSSFDPKGLLT